MKILETIRGRRSIRDFMQRPIPEESIGALIEAIRWAPSAGNLQSRKFYFVFNEGLKKKLAAVSGNPGFSSRVKGFIKNALDRNFVSSAPLLVVACMDRGIFSRYGERGENLYAIQDVSASVMSMMLVAHELGLGSVWVGAFSEDAVAEILGLPENERPLTLVPVGYPAQTPPAPPRIAAEDAVKFLQ